MDSNKKLRNLSFKILLLNRKTYCARLVPKVVNEDKKFWKSVMPLFSNKVQSSSSITLLENGIVESTESKVAEVFNEYL